MRRGQHAVVGIIGVIILAEGELLSAQGLLDGGGQLLVLIHAQDQVDLGDLVLQRVLVALAEAAGDDQQLAAAGFLVLSHLEDRVDGFLLRALDEAAGVHHQDVRLGGIAGEDVAVVCQKPQRGFGVHAVLVAAQGDHADGKGLGHRGLQLFRNSDVEKHIPS